MDRRSFAKATLFALLISSGVKVSSQAGSNDRIEYMLSIIEDGLRQGDVKEWSWKAFHEIAEQWRQSGCPDLDCVDAIVAKYEPRRLA